MRTRRWVLLASFVVLVAIGATMIWALPEIIRRVAIARIQALTGRPTQIERVEANVLTGRLTVHGVDLAEPDGQPFADLKRLDVHVKLLALLRGHVWLRDLVLDGSTVRVVRLSPNDFNFSDIITRSGGGSGEAGSRVTVEHFALTNGTVVLEDRTLPQPRTWRSERITIDGHNVSTERGDGTARGSSIIAGAQASFAITELRLAPIRVRSTMSVQGLDLTLAQMYLPPDTVVVDGGRATVSITATIDAAAGIQAAGTGQVEHVALSRDGDPVLVVPRLTARVQDFAFRDGESRVGQLVADGAVQVRDPVAKQRGRFRHADLRAKLANLTWPATAPGQVDVLATVQGAGKLELTGTVDAPPAPSALRLRVTNFDLAPWAQFAPVNGRVRGVAEADVRVNEPLAVGIPARLQGSIVVNRAAVADGQKDVVSARRIEASGLELHWPTHALVQRVTITAPRGLVERDREGRFPLTDLVVSTTAPARPAVARSSASGTPKATPFAVNVGEIIVKDGGLAWRDQMVTPPARLDMTSIDARVTGIGWPLKGPAQVRVALQPPGGGQLDVNGRVELEPIAADLRVVARGAELAPYQPYLPTPARISGAADLDVAVALRDLAERRASVTGTVGLARVEVRDPQRTMVRVERVRASGVEVAWPERVDVAKLLLTQPWLLLERDGTGALTLKGLLPAHASASASNGSAASVEPLSVTVAQLDVERGAVRVVDGAVSPAFAVDFQPATVRARGLSTIPGKTARVELNGQLGPGAELDLRGTIGSLGAPLKLDLNGEVRQFAVPRANPYMLRQAGWKSVDGRLTSKVQAKIDGDALAAKTDTTISRLRLVRASPEDKAEGRLGLPLSTLTSLMKDRQGNITVAFPVSGRLTDPKFDFSDAIWGAVRRVAVNAIALPVSWIGRVRTSPDARVEHIEVDPVTFEPGTADATPDGRAQLAKLAAFFERLPEVRMVMTPVVSARDLEAMTREKAPASERPPAPERGVAGESDGSASPTTRADQPASGPAKLAKQRLEVVRSTIKAAGIDAKRLEEKRLVQDDETRTEVQFALLEPEPPPPPSRIRETVDRVRETITGTRP